MELGESAENYLETILLLQREHGPVRPVEIANRLGFSRPSVCHAVGLLRQAGYLESEDGRLRLTPKGEAAAGEVFERHLLLCRMLRSFGVGEEAAGKDALQNGAHRQRGDGALPARGVRGSAPARADRAPGRAQQERIKTPLRLSGVFVRQ